MKLATINVMKFMFIKRTPRIYLIHKNSLSKELFMTSMKEIQVSQKVQVKFSQDLSLPVQNDSVFLE